MKKRKLFLSLNQTLLTFLIIFGANVGAQAQVFYKQNAAGVVVINAAYGIDSTRTGIPNGETVSLVDTSTTHETEPLNDSYLLLPNDANYYGSADGTMVDATNGTNAETDAPAAYYNVNFNTTGSYKIYAHANFGADGAFWVMYAGEHARFENYGSHDLWVYRDNRTNKPDKLLTVNTTGPQAFAIMSRKAVVEKIDKIFLVENSMTFDPAAYVASDELHDLTIDGTSVDGFDAATLTYNVSLPVGVASAAVVAIPLNDSAAVAITSNGAITLGGNEGDITVATITVTSEDGSASQDYTINIKNTDLSSDASLQDLKVDGTTITGFDAATFTYSIIVPGGTASVEIAALATDDGKAVVSGTGTVDLSAHTIVTKDVVVTAEDGTTKQTYSVTVAVEYLYGDQIVYQQNDSGLVIINAASFDSIQSGTDNDIVKICDAETGVINDRYIQMPGATSYSTANTSASRVYYTVNFKETGTYKMYVHDNPLSTTEKAFWFGLNSPDYQWATWNTVQLNDWYWHGNSVSTGKLVVTSTGEQIFSIYQRDKNIKIDRIILVHDTVSFSPTGYMANTDLIDLQYDGTSITDFITLDSMFVELPLFTASTTVTAIPENDSASIVIKADGVVSVDGVITVSSTDTVMVTVDVISEDGTATNSDTIYFAVTPAGSDATLSSLKIDGVSVKKFSPSITAYDSVVPYGTTSVVISATATNVNSTFVIKDNGVVTDDGSIDLTTGIAIVTIVVTAEDGVTNKTYTINLSQYVRSKDATLASLMIDGVSVPGFNSDTLLYHVKFNMETTFIELSAKVSQVSATFSGTGKIDVSSGSKVVNVVVKAEDPSVSKIYAIDFRKMAAGTTGTIVESAAGILDFEAEDYTTNFVGAAFDYWTVVGPDTDYSGEEYVKAPAINVNKYMEADGASLNAPKLTYAVNFADTGAYYVWTRAYFEDGDSDSFFYGLDTVLDNNDKVNGWKFLKLLQWVKGTNAIKVSKAGEQTFSIFEREWNAIVDRVILTADANFNPDNYIASSALIDLSINDTTIDGFVSDTLTYKVVFPEGTTAVKIGAVAYNSNTEIVIDGADAIDANGGDILIKVTAEDGGSPTNYTINYTVGTVGVSSSVFENAKVYPNPTRNILTLANMCNAKVKVFNLQGTLLNSLHVDSNNLNMDVSNIKAGMYLLQIELDGQFKNLSFVIE